MVDKIKKSKSKSNRNKDDMDFGDFDDLDDLNGLNFSDEVEPKSRKPTKGDIGKAFLNGVGGEFKSSVMGKLAKKSLPDEFETYSSDLSDLSYFASDTLDTAKTKLKKPIARIAKETKKFLPESFKTINGWMDKIIEKTDDSGAYQQQSEEAARDTQITSELGNIFDKQLEVTKALAARDEASADVDRKINLNNIKRTQDLLTDISASSSTINAFNMQIAKEYYKKSLELQFRSYYIQADTLRSIKEHYPIYKSQFDAIIKNTGLPDYVKIKTDEKYFEIIRQQTMESFNKNIMGNSKFINTVKNNITNAVKSKISDVSYAIDNISDALSGIGSASEMSGESKSGMVSGIIGSLMGSTATDWVSKKIGDKIKPHLAKSRIVQRGKNLLGAYATSPQVAAANGRESMRNWQTKLENEENNPEQDQKRGFVSKITNKLKQFGANAGVGLLDLTNTPNQDRTLNKESILTTKTPAVFDQMVYRSITHVIPLYLAHILKENQALNKRFKAEGGEVMEYNYNDRKLDTKTNVQMAYTKHLQKGSMGDKAKNTAMGIIDSIDNKKLSKDNKKDLTQTLESYLREATNSLPPEMLTYENLYGTGDKVPGVIKDLRKNYHGMDTIIKEMEKAAKTVEGAYKLKQSSKQLLGSNNAKEIQDLFKLVSELAGKVEMDIGQIKTLTSIKEISVTDEECTVINFSFTKFVVDEQKVFTILRLPEAFKYIVNNDMLISKIIIFLTIVKVVTTRSEFKANYSLMITRALGEIYTNIVNDIKTSPEQIQTIYGINPGIFDYDKITSTNLMGLSFGKSNVTNTAETNFEALVNKPGEFLKMSDKVQANMMGESLEKQLLSKVDAFAKVAYGKGKEAYKSINEARQSVVKTIGDIKAAGNSPDLQALLIKKAMDDSFNAVYNVSKAAKAKFDKGLTSLSTSLTTLGDKGRDKVVSKLQETVTDINNLIAEKEKEKELMNSVEEDLNTAVSQQFNGAKTINSMHTQFIDSEIKALKATSEKLTELSASVAKLNFNVPDKAALKKSYVSLKKRINAAIDSIKESSKKFNEDRDKYIKAQETEEKNAAEALARAEPVTA